MPFANRARVFLRNDTEVDIANYSFVEWERLDEWNEGLGYFHATYSRRCFQLTRDTDEVFLELEGRGHLIGRQYSVVTDEPLFDWNTELCIGCLRCVRACRDLRGVGALSFVMKDGAVFRHDR